MKFFFSIIILIILIQISENLFGQDISTCKYFFIDNNEINTSYNRRQEVLSFYSDSTYQLIYTLSKTKKKSIVTVHEEIHTGKWTLKNDTLILVDDYNNVKESFFIKGRKLKYIDEFKIYKKNRVFKYLEGNDSFRDLLIRKKE